MVYDVLKVGKLKVSVLVCLLMCCTSFMDIYQVLEVPIYIKDKCWMVIIFLNCQNT